MSYPPSDPKAAEKWANNNDNDALRYAVGWLQSGQGYGDEQAKKEWPECPGCDWDDGIPDWCESDFPDWANQEYRTVIVNPGFVWSPPQTVGTWELVSTVNVNPEPELYDEDGSPTGVMYIGEYAMELIYKNTQIGE